MSPPTVPADAPVIAVTARLSWSNDALSSSFASTPFVAALLLVTVAFSVTDAVSATPWGPIPFIVIVREPLLVAPAPSLTVYVKTSV